MLQFFPRLEFEAAVRQHQAERHAPGFSCWTQFIAMLFCQLAMRNLSGRSPAVWPPAAVVAHRS